LSPVHYRRGTPRPVSYYALFKWWLLLSQHPGCPRGSTSFRTERHSGALAGGPGCSPLGPGDCPPEPSCRALYTGIRSLAPTGSRVGPRSESVALVPEFFNTRGFGRPVGVTPPSSWPGVGHVVSRLPPATQRPVGTRFPCGCGPEALNHAADGKSPDHYAKGTQSGMSRSP
jgi:hypothetical protein